MEDINIGMQEELKAPVTDISEKQPEEKANMQENIPVQHQKKFEFSKIVFLIIFLITVGVTLFSMLLMWKTESVTPLVYLIPSTYTAFATATGFYFDKAKKENLIKLRSTYGNEMMDKVKGDV